MRRREFIAGLGSAAAWPVVAAAQRAAVPVVAVLIGGDLTPEQRAAFARGLAETGYVEGRNVAIEYHDRGGDLEGVLRKLADNLARQRVAVIATPGSLPAAVAAKAVTRAIPIVFGIGSDPVEGGLVESFSHPGANVTGYTEMQADVVSKRLGLLHTLAPNSARFGVLIDPHSPIGEIVAREALAAAKAIGKPIEVFSMDDDAAFEGFFSNLPHSRIDALLLSPGSFFFVRRHRVIELADRHRVSVAYWLREFPEAGGLMSYGSSIQEMDRQVGIYVGRILKGEKPADLPVVRATKFELVINAKAAKALGLTIPETLLATADEVIQ